MKKYIIVKDNISGWYYACRKIFGMAGIITLVEGTVGETVEECEAQLKEVVSKKKTEKVKEVIL